MDARCDLRRLRRLHTLLFNQLVEMRDLIKDVPLVRIQVHGLLEKMVGSLRVVHRGRLVAQR